MLITTKQRLSLNFGMVHLILTSFLCIIDCDKCMEYCSKTSALQTLNINSILMIKARKTFQHALFVIAVVCNNRNLICTILLTSLHFFSGLLIVID